MQLHGTPLSHFTRKIRILLAELGVAYDRVWSPGVMGVDARSYGDNPMLRVPVLVDGDLVLHDSEHIARYLVRHGDPLGVNSVAVADLNQLAVANAIMANEVVLILAERGGLKDLSSSYFAKLRTAIADGLAWLDRTVDGDAFTWKEIATICMWDHVAHYGLVPLGYPRLAAHVAQFAARPSVASTTPAALQREAAAV